MYYYIIFYIIHNSNTYISIYVYVYMLTITRVEKVSIEKQNERNYVCNYYCNVGITRIIK